MPILRTLKYVVASNRLALLLQATYVVSTFLLEGAFGHLCGTLSLLSSKLCLGDLEMFARSQPFATVSGTSSCLLTTRNLPAGGFDFVCNHFLRNWSVDRYSFPTSATTHCEKMNLFPTGSLNRSYSSNTSGNEHGFLRNRIIWFGANASKSCGSVETGQLICHPKSSLLQLENFLGLVHLRDVLLPLECRILLLGRISLSHTPPL